MSRIAVNGWSGIWRASVPARAVAVCIRSFRRQPRPKLTRSRGRQLKAPAPFLSWILCATIFSYTCALPANLGFFFLSHGAPAMTKGCKKGTCCTALCYVDKYGIHHCVHKPGGDSCECGLSANDLDENPMPPTTLVTLPKFECPSPALIPSGWICGAPTLISSFDPATPSPPPK